MPRMIEKRVIAYNVLTKSLTRRSECISLFVSLSLSFPPFLASVSGLPNNLHKRPSGLATLKSVVAAVSRNTIDICVEGLPFAIANHGSRRCASSFSFVPPLFLSFLRESRVKNRIWIDSELNLTLNSPDIDYLQRPTWFSLHVSPRPLTLLSTLPLFETFRNIILFVLKCHARSEHTSLLASAETSRTAQLSPDNTSRSR